MPLSDSDIGNILLEQSYVSQEELKTAQEQSKKLSIPLLSVLINQGLLTRQLYEGALAEHYKLPFYDLTRELPPPEVIMLIPEEIARRYSVVVVKREGNVITVATSDPGNTKLEEAIRMNFEQEEPLFPEGVGEVEEEKKAKPLDSAPFNSLQGKQGKKAKKDETLEEPMKEEKPSLQQEHPPAQPESAEAGRGGLPGADAEVSLKGDKETQKKKSKFSFSFGKKKGEQFERKKFTGTITFVYAPQSVIESIFKHFQKPLATRFQQIIREQKKVAPEILEEILDDAIQLRASDVHFEPQEKIVVVRFRVDGVMHEAGRIPKEHYEGVLNRIKIDGNMRIDEHFTPQDGAIRHPTPSGPVDIRVSVVPVVDGEKAVMRLLSEYVRYLTLADLGFSDGHQEILKAVAHKPFGMILTTGPTGSGKSTTLYALVKLRNAPDVNISTIEDPVEYKIAGINHIQVNPKAQLTFASGLRALVRQDPDILLVGEIRDRETADISVNAALTGHLLFSTLHANDAATAIPRLLEMGVEPFLLASTLEIVIGQRLVRRICPQCRYSYTVEFEEARKLFPGAEEFFKGSKSVTLYKGKGCETCGDTGYRGRVGIYELFVITPEIEQLIITRATSSDINSAARRNGMKLMFEDGFDKMMTGMTTIAELLRVAAPPDLLLPLSDDSDK